MAGGVNSLGNLQGKVNANGALVVALDGGAAAAELVTVTKDAIGTTSTDGVVIQNTTDAAAGAQQYSPRIRLRGEGWKTDATAASQTVDFALEVQPVQGTSAPTGNFILKASINGGAFSTVGTFTSAGQLQSVVGSTGTPTYAFTGDPNTGLYWRGADEVAMSLGGTTRTHWWASFLAISSNMGFGWAAGTDASSGLPDTYWSRAAAGAARLNSASAANTYDITLADWGTTLSAESVSVNDAATLNLGAAPLGALTITVGTDNLVGKFQLRGSSNAVVADDGNDAIFTTTKDTASSINVYFDTNAYFIQNTRGGARSVRVLLVGA